MRDASFAPLALLLASILAGLMLLAWAFGGAWIILS